MSAPALERLGLQGRSGLGSSPSCSKAGLAFDRLAPAYDSLWTESLVGRAQRAAVWRKTQRVFRAGDHLLELNCGTGEDAFFFTRAGLTITACDASLGMIHRAQERQSREDPERAVCFVHLASEDLARAAGLPPFDGIFSNFSGLNCVRDLPALGSVLRSLLPHGASMLLCVSSRVCLWEMAYHLRHGQVRKAMRRLSGVSNAILHGHEFPVYYPTLEQWRSAFRPGFQLRSATGIGVAVPPSYLEEWSAEHPKVLSFLELVDTHVNTWPGLRAWGDHVLLHFEAV